MARKKKAAKRTPAPRGGRKDASFEVEDQATAAAAPSGGGATLETGLVFVTFVALIIGLVLSQLELSSSFGKGFF